MEIEVSQKTDRLAKTLKVTPLQMAFADLVSLGWEPTDAYIVAFRKGATWVKKALKEEVDKLLNSTAIQDRITENKRVLSERQKESIKNAKEKDVNDVINTAMSKEQMLYDLQTAKRDKPVGSKEWLEINKLIVDVTRMKQEEVQQDDSAIVYHLPAQYPTGCQDCLWQRCNTCKYKKFYDKNGGE